MNVLPLFVPNSEPPVAAKPRQRSFNHPSVVYEFLAGDDALSGDANFDPEIGQGRAVRNARATASGLRRFDHETRFDRFLKVIGSEVGSKGALDSRHRKNFC